MDSCIAFVDLKVHWYIFYDVGFTTEKEKINHFLSVLYQLLLSCGIYNQLHKVNSLMRQVN